MSSYCQHCGTPVTDPWTLCQSCRRLYAHTLHQLTIAMRRLQQITLHDYRLTSGDGGNHSGFPAVPIDLNAADLLRDIETMLQDMLNETGVESRPKWQRILRWTPKHMTDLCQASRSGYYLDQCARALLRVQPLTDRIPRQRRLVGQCPHCGRPVNATPRDQWAACPCGHLLDLDIIRYDSRALISRLHKTMTPAGCAKWLADEYGLSVSRKTISTWLGRGKLPGSKPVGDGCWEFNLRELLQLAESSQLE
ncbi:hypothetical protein [Bifidobacterium tissieri]|uniref:hypothetical protein n=1 Tax=Bifidobacterium tissieri TaxID=1630162 RepID=UPI001CC30011|nr:hypothetical protein [Bifidobacterium tissieri]